MTTDTSGLGLNIKFKTKNDLIWVSDDICKMQAWTHLNEHLGNIPDKIGESVDVAGSEFIIKDVQPVVGWAIGTCFEITAGRKYPDDGEDV
jgi:hypothetical protein